VYAVAASESRHVAMATVGTAFKWRVNGSPGKRASVAMSRLLTDCRPSHIPHSDVVLYRRAAMSNTVQLLQQHAAPVAAAAWDAVYR